MADDLFITQAYRTIQTVGGVVKARTSYAEQIRCIIEIEPA